jgi:hypothetical protein
VAARGPHSGELARLQRHAWEEQRRFPLQITTLLSQRFASHGLQFFKVNKSVTHVSVARPHYLDLETTPVSDGVKRIVQFIEAHPRCTRRRLVQELAPSPLPPPVVVDPVATPAPAPVPGEAPAAPAPPAPATLATEPTPEQTAIIADLHWLIHQGHVIEFANGMMETAKKPLPRPPKPSPKVEQKPAEAAAAEPAPTGTPLSEDVQVVESVAACELPTAQPNPPTEIPASESAAASAPEMPPLPSAPVSAPEPSAPAN